MATGFLLTHAPGILCNSNRATAMVPWTREVFPLTHLAPKLVLGEQGCSSLEEQERRLQHAKNKVKNKIESTFFLLVCVCVSKRLRLSLL